MRILLLGNFAGSGGPPREPLADRPTHRIDVDTLDIVMQRLRPEVTVNGRSIACHQLDDFHPDRIYARLPLFQDLQRAGLAAPDPAAPDDLARLLGQRVEPAAVTPSAPASGLDALIRHIVAPHVVKEPSAAAKMHLDAVHTAMASEMRALLHDRRFQALESIWRAVALIVSRVDLDDQLQLHLLDVTREELLADLAGAEGRIGQTALYRALVGRRSAANPLAWSYVAVLDTFGPAAADIALLTLLGSVAAQAGGPLLAGADVALAEQGDASAWRALRTNEVAKWIGLAAPRLLLRLPYGASTDPIEAFPFDECVGPPVHDELLWAPASVATALLAAKAFAAHGWDMEPGDEREIDDLPPYTFVRDGEREMQASAERFMTETEASALIQAGLMPVVSRRDRHAAVVPRFQSIAEPFAPLGR